MGDSLEESPLIPEGVYDLGFVEYRTWLFKGRQPKVVLYFRIVSQGGYFGLVIRAYYNVTNTIGKRERNGGFKAAKKSKLVRDFATVFPNHRFTRFDRIPISNLSRVVVSGKIGTVTHGSNQREIPEQVRYSVVREILGSSTS